MPAPATIFYQGNRESPVQEPRPRASAPSRRRGVWIGVLSSAAAVALVCTVVIQSGNNAARNPASIQQTTVTSSTDIVTLSEAIKRNPNSADLYMKRAKEYERAERMDEALTDAERATKLTPADIQAHLLYAQLLEKVHKEDQAIEEYKKVQSLKPPPDVLAIATERVAQLERQRSIPNR